MCEKWIKRQEDSECWWVALNDPLELSHEHLFDVYVPNYAEYKGLEAESKTFPTTDGSNTPQVENGGRMEVDWIGYEREYP